MRGLETEAARQIVSAAREKKAILCLKKCLTPYYGTHCRLLYEVQWRPGRQAPRPPEGVGE